MSGKFVLFYFFLLLLYLNDPVCFSYLLSLDATCVFFQNTWCTLTVPSRSSCETTGKPFLIWINYKGCSNIWNSLSKTSPLPMAACLVHLQLSNKTDFRQNLRVLFSDPGNKNREYVHASRTFWTTHYFFFRTRALCHRPRLVIYQSATTQERGSRIGQKSVFGFTTLDLKRCDRSILTYNNRLTSPTSSRSISPSMELVETH